MTREERTKLGLEIVSKIEDAEQRICKELFDLKMMVAKTLLHDYTLTINPEVKEALQKILH